MVPHPGAPGMRPGPGYQQQYPPMMGPMRGHPPGMRFPPGESISRGPVCLVLLAHQVSDLNSHPHEVVSKIV